MHEDAGGPSDASCPSSSTRRPMHRRSRGEALTLDRGDPPPRSFVPGARKRTWTALESLGLGGDGDEWEAIARVERDFGMHFDGSDAPRWRTVGDVHASLLRVSPETQLQPNETWSRLVSALAAETGADPQRVGPETLLLAIPLWDLAGRWLKGLIGR